MKKATLTITMVMEETPENLDALKELQEGIDNGEIVEAYNDEDIDASVSLVIEDV